LAGGVYGVAIGGFFSAESMFHRRTDASKVALCGLVERLVQLEFELLDIQFVTPHTARMGATEIPREDYLARLASARRRTVGNFSRPA
jgi:leucyl/phenylalanyl-tRNA--protein transferase